MVSRAAGEEVFSGGRREEGWEEIKEGEVALVYVPYRAEGNAGLDETRQVWKVHAGSLRPYHYLAEVNAGEFTVPGRCM